MFKVLWKNTAKIIHQDIIEHKIVLPLASGQYPEEDRLVVGWWVWWCLVGVFIGMPSVYLKP